MDPPVFGKTRTGEVRKGSAARDHVRKHTGNFAAARRSNA
jgi:hypothetical protein